MIDPVAHLGHEVQPGTRACRWCRTERFDGAECPVRLRANLDAVWALVNTPQTEDFVEAVKLEAAHQQLRWGTEHDTGKTDADWFWLVGYLAGKALHKPEKRLHHIVTTAAALLNWHRHLTGEGRMRLGIGGSRG